MGNQPNEHSRIPVAFALVMDLAKALGISGISKMPGCWEYAHDDFALTVNGHSKPTRAADGSEVPPFTAVISRGGWPLAMVTPVAGMCFGVTESEVEDILRAEVARVKEAA